MGLAPPHTILMGIVTALAVFALLYGTSWPIPLVVAGLVFYTVTVLAWEYLVPDSSLLSRKT